MDLCLLVLLLLLGGCSFGQSKPCTGHGCQCRGDVNIDLNGFFNYPVTGIPDNTGPATEKYVYSFSPCTPMMCYTGQANTAALCQYDSTNPSAAVSLGSTQNISWSVTSEDEFTLTITGGAEAYAPNLNRQSKIRFQYVSNISENEMIFLGEVSDVRAKTLTYEFAIQFTTTHTSDGGAHFGILSIVLIVLSIVVVATFLIVGGLVLYFRFGKKARGIFRQRGYQDL